MKIAKKICAGAIAAALTALLAGVSAAADVPPPERLRARESFEKDGFGIFVHWGLYAAWGKGEWYLNKSLMPLADYEAEAAAFNPTNFDARAWAKAFAGAGALRHDHVAPPRRLLDVRYRADGLRRRRRDAVPPRSAEGACRRVRRGVARARQPAHLIENNSHADLLDGEDFQIWEINNSDDHVGHMNDRVSASHFPFLPSSTFRFSRIILSVSSAFYFTFLSDSTEPTSGSK